MEVTQVPLIKAVPLDYKPPCHCVGHREPKLVRFGECVLCTHDDCLTDWVLHTAKRMGAAKFRTDWIRKRGKEEWKEYLAYFLVHAWERIVLYGQAGLGHFDIANAARSFIAGRTKYDRDQPNLLVTKPNDIVQEEWDDEGDEVAQDTIRGLVSYDDPYESVRIAEVVNAIQDPIVVMELAEQISLAEAALLSDVSVVAYKVYRERVANEVRANATKKPRQAA